MRRFFVRLLFVKLGIGLTLLAIFLVPEFKTAREEDENNRLAGVNEKRKELLAQAEKQDEQEKNLAAAKAKQQQDALRQSVRSLFPFGGLYLPEDFIDGLTYAVKIQKQEVEKKEQEVAQKKEGEKKEAEKKGKEVEVTQKKPGTDFESVRIAEIKMKAEIFKLELDIEDLLKELHAFDKKFIVGWANPLKGKKEERREMVEKIGAKVIELEARKKLLGEKISEQKLKSKK